MTFGERGPNDDHDGGGRCGEKTPRECPHCGELSKNVPQHIRHRCAEVER